MALGSDGRKGKFDMTSDARPQALQAFLDALERAFQAAAAGQDTGACRSRVFAALRRAGPVSSDPERTAAGALLDDALQPARRAGGELGLLAERISALNPLLTWRRRTGTPAEGSDPDAELPANCMVVGPGGLEDRQDVWVGISLMASGVRYPTHRHPPEEIYLVLTDGRFRQGEADWFRPGIGGTIYNEPGILHAMEAAADTPFLAIWCLFDTRHAAPS